MLSDDSTEDPQGDKDKEKALQKWELLGTYLVFLTVSSLASRASCGHIWIFLDEFISVPIHKVNFNYFLILENMKYVFIWNSL